MPPAPNRRPLPPSAHRDTEQQHYREELTRLTEVRHLAEAQAAEAKADVARILPQLLTFGVPVKDVIAITELSRGTVYRMLDEGNKLQDLRGLIEELETAVRQITLELGHACVPQELADYLEVSMGEAQLKLMLVHSLLRDDLATFRDSVDAAITSPLVHLAGQEPKLLKMLISQGKSKKKIAAATGLTEDQVTARASLALLRLIPALRGDHTSATGSQSPVTSPPSP
jgi:hypothetical protein